MDWDVTPQEAGKFQAALVSAFPNRTDLKEIVNASLERDLEEITSPDTYPDMVTRLVTWASANGKAWVLLEAAHVKNPGNLKLRNFYEQIKASRSAGGVEGEPSVPGARLYAVPDIPESLIQELVELLLRLSLLDSFSGRTATLLISLPQKTKSRLKRDESSPWNDVRGIVEQLAKIGQLADGRWPLLVMIDSALPAYEDLKIGGQLKEIRGRLAQIYQVA